GDGISSAVYLLPAQHVGFFVAANTGGPFVFDAFRAFMDRFYSTSVVSPTPSPTPPANPVHEPLDRFTGSYIQTRTAHTTLEKVSDLLTMHFEATVQGDMLVINGNRFVEVDPLYFHFVGGGPTQNIALRPNAAGNI